MPPPSVIDRSRWLAATAMCACALFVLITLAYRAGLTSAADSAAYALFASVDEPALDAIAQADDDIARVAPTFAAAVVMATVLAWKGPRWAWLVPLSIGLTAVVEFFAKLGFARAVHLGELIRAAQEFIGVRFATGGSFPSGHVARTVFLATVAVRLFPVWVAIPLIVVASLTFLARLYIEAHRLSDVLGGAALGVAIASGALWIRALVDEHSAYSDGGEEDSTDRSQRKSNRRR